MKTFTGTLANLFRSRARDLDRAPLPYIVQIAKPDARQALRDMFARAFARAGIMTPVRRFRANPHSRKAGPGRRHGHGVKS